MNEYIHALAHEGIFFSTESVNKVNHGKNVRLLCFIPLGCVCWNAHVDCRWYDQISKDVHGLQYTPDDSLLFDLLGEKVSCIEWYRVVVIAFQQYDCIFFEWNCYLRTYGTCNKLALILDKKEARMYEGDIFEGKIISKFNFKLLKNYFWSVKLLQELYFGSNKFVLSCAKFEYSSGSNYATKFPRSVFH